MTFVHLPIQFETKFYKLNSFLGLLLEFEGVNQNYNNAILPQKLCEAIDYCNNPYRLNKCNSIVKENRSIFVRKLLNVYSSVLIKTNTFNFWLGRSLAGFRLPCFAETSQAINFFRCNKSGDIQNNLCLPRSLFAASTSKSFKKNGVILIGVSLPSNLMHAWIIENGTQPDPLDNIWINFQPVAAIY